MQHKKTVLFLISLSQNKIQEIEEKGVNYELFLKTIQGYSHVEVHETISEKLLNKASSYKVVVIVGHQVNGSIEIADGSLFPMSKIAQALPPQFNGYLHVAVCGSSSIRNEIKLRCPDSRVRTSNRVTQLELQFLIYSQLLSHTDLSKETFDYWYESHRDYIKEIQKRKNPEDLAKFPCATKLGTIDSSASEKRVSVSSQKFVRRNYIFPIYVCLHYDFEKEEIEAVIKEQNHDADDLVKIGKLKAIPQKDEVKIKLSMLDHHKHTTDLITVCDSPSTFTKTITICEEYQKAIFDVLVTENYSDNEFWSRVEVFKDCQRLIEPFCIKHTILTEEQYTRKIDVNILLGQKRYTGAPKSEIIELDSEKYLDLKYFTSFNTLEKQNVLRNTLREVAKKIDVDAGRDWVPVYIAYSFYSGKLKLVKRYVNFFTDIESLMPNTLTKIRQNETGDKRYRSYTESLAGECGNWFIKDNSLPSMNEWKSSDYRYSVTDDRKREVQQLVAEIHKKLKREQ